MKRTLRDLITYAQFNIDGERVMMQKNVRLLEQASAAPSGSRIF